LSRLTGLTSTVQLKVVQTLNRESIDKYRIQILAKDGGTPAKVGTLNVNIAVADVADTVTIVELMTTSSASVTLYRSLLNLGDSSFTSATAIFTFYNRSQNRRYQNN
jgi:hypothetical protein